MPRLTVNDVDLNVADVGSGPAVLLLHGFPDSHAPWRHQVPALVAAGYRAIVPDLRGFGLSTQPEHVADYKIDRLLADVIGVLPLDRPQAITAQIFDWLAQPG